MRRFALGFVLVMLVLVPGTAGAARPVVTLAGAPAQAKAGEPFSVAVRVRGSSARVTVVMTRPLEPASRDAGPGVALELRHVLSQQARMLDLARTAESIFVLSPTAVVQYKQIDGSWRIAD